MRSKLELSRDAARDGKRRRGELYGYRFDAGEGPAVSGQALRLSEVATSQWTEVTRDLWQDFGDFTITGLTCMTVGGRDAAMDRIYVARALADFKGMPRPTARREWPRGPVKRPRRLPPRRSFRRRWPRRRPLTSTKAQPLLPAMPRAASPLPSSCTPT